MHILDFSRSIYGRRIEVFFYDKIRGEVKFNGLDELKAQLSRDKQTAREWITDKDLQN